MIFNFQQVLLQLITLILLAICPLAANSTNDDLIREKRIKVALRMIGHEVLLSLDDKESRVLPIEQIEDSGKFDSYRISFETEFSIDPGLIGTIIEEVMLENKLEADYFLEVEQCETKKVVYGFEISRATRRMIPCDGRILPKDCYSFIITILEGNEQATYKLTSSSDHSLLQTSKTQKRLQILAFLLVPILMLGAFFTYKRNKKDLEVVDPNLVMIGASKFDKRNGVLSYNNKRMELSNKEAELLSLLHTSANAPLKREVILEKVWGDQGDYVGRTLDVFISKLRKKLEADTSVKIVNIRGVGYKLVMNVPG